MSFTIDQWSHGKNNIEMYSTNNERKSVVAENFKAQNLKVHDFNI